MSVSSTKRLTVAIILSLLAAPGAMAGAATGADPDPACLTSTQSCVRGSGSFQVTAEGEGLRVTYGCDVLGSTFTVSTVIRPEADEGCALKRGSATVDTARGASTPTRFTATGDSVTLGPGTGTLRVCWKVRATFSNGSLLEDSGCAPAVPAGGGPHIEDVAGDANGLNAAGLQLDTRPASYDRADLLTIRMETTYDTVPVGEDGVHHEPTGLAITVGTVATPGTIEDREGLVYRVDTVIAGCRSYLEAWIYNDVTTARWDQVDGPPAACPDGENQQAPGHGSKPEWTATVDPASKTVRSWYPFASLSARQADYLKVGNSLRTPRGGTLALREYSTWNGATGRIGAGLLLDATATGPDFVIGSDVPPDVPCTKGCP
ncbi:MAG TPA: hypothetical protein VGB28_09195 [Actinomycetota bacterium]|jgi:hypothetical protein